MFSFRNIILLPLCTSFFLMTVYLRHLNQAEKSKDLTKTYLNFIDTIDKNRFDSAYLQFTLNELSTKPGFNYCGTAGYSGNKVPIINPSPLFQRTLSESQLTALCEKSGPVVKHFAFIALYQLNFKSAIKVFKTQIYDSTELDYECGCIGGAMVSINLDFLNTIKGKLTDFERLSYLKKIKSRCNPFVYEVAIKFFDL